MIGRSQSGRDLKEAWLSAFAPLTAGVGFPRGVWEAVRREPISRMITNRNEFNELWGRQWLPHEVFFFYMKYIYMNIDI